MASSDGHASGKKSLYSGAGVGMLKQMAKLKTVIMGSMAMGLIVKTRRILIWSLLFVPSLLFAAGDSLSDRLVSPDAAVRQTALGQLPALDPHAKHELVLSLSESLRNDPAPAERAARALEAMGSASQDAIIPLADALHFDEDSVAQAVGDALIKIGPASVPRLAKETTDTNFIVRRRSAQILGRFGPQARDASSALVRLVEDPQFDVSAAAQDALIKIGDPAIPSIVSEMRSADATTRRSFIRLLGKLGPSAAPPLIRSLKKDENAYVRAGAAEALGGLKNAADTAVPALTDALKDLDDDVRVAAANALGQFGPAAGSAIFVLKNVAQNDTSSLVQQRASDAVKEINAPAATVSASTAPAAAAPIQNSHPSMKSRKR